jgi:hypothetical protein
MCDPVSATALALSAGGTFLQSREAANNADRVTGARNAAYEREMIGQRKFADESGVAFNQNLRKQGREAFDEQAEADAAQTKQAFNNIRTQPDYNMGVSGSTPKNVVIARQAASDDATAKTDRDLDAMAGLSGYQGALFNQDMGRSEFARLFGNLQDKASRRSALIPLEVNAAGNNASKSPSLFPTLLKAAGTGLGIYGAGSGITSFGDKTVQGPFVGMGPGAPVQQPGLFTKLKTIPGNFY